MKPDKSTAIIKLVSGVSFSITPDGKIVKWNSDKEQPTEEEIQAKLKELQADYDTKKYQRDRQPEFPSIPDQLDKIYHSGLTEWKKDIKAVKDKYPKPE